MLRTKSLWGIITTTITQLFDLVVKDAKALIIVILLVIVILLMQQNASKDQRQVKENTRLYEMMIEKIEASTKEEVTEQLKPIADTVNSVSQSIKDNLRNEEVKNNSK